MTSIIPRAGGIYQWRQLSVKRKYIGSSEDLRARHTAHISKLNNGTHNNPFFQAAWDKYGASDFVFSVLEIIEDRAQRLDREQWYLDNVIDWNKDFNIAKYVTRPPGMTGKRHSQETKKKLSETHKKIGNRPPSRKGTKATAAQKAEMSERNKRLGLRPPAGWNREKSPATRQKLSEALTGKKYGPLKPETKAKLSKGHKEKGIKPPSTKGRKASPEERAANSKRQKGKVIPQAQREQISKTLKAQGRRPPGMKGMKHSEETRQKMRDAQKRRREREAK